MNLLSQISHVNTLRGVEFRVPLKVKRGDKKGGEKKKRFRVKKRFTKVQNVSFEYFTSKGCCASRGQCTKLGIKTANWV